VSRNTYVRPILLSPIPREGGTKQWQQNENWEEQVQALEEENQQLQDQGDLGEKMPARNRLRPLGEAAILTAIPSKEGPQAVPENAPVLRPSDG